MSLTQILWMLGTFVGPFLLGVYTWSRTRGTASPVPPDPVPIWPGVVNASLLFALAFNLVYFVQEFFLAWPKSLLPGVEAVVYHNNHNWSGEHPDVLLYQGAGAAAIIVFGALMLLLGKVLGKRLGEWYGLWWWTAFMALGLGLAQVPIAVLDPGGDTGQAYAWLELAPLTQDLFSLLGIIVTAAFGIYFARALLAMAPAGSVITPRSRVLYVLKFGFIPLILGTLLAWPNRAPGISHLILPAYSAFILLPWTLAAAAITSDVQPVSDRVHRRFDWPLLALSVLVLLVFRFVLAPGIGV